MLQKRLHPPSYFLYFLCLWIWANRRPSRINYIAVTWNWCFFKIQIWMWPQLQKYVLKKCIVQFGVKVNLNKQL